MTTVRIAPTVTRDSSSVTAVGGDAEDVVADIADDNTYVDVDPNGGFIDFGFADIVLPSGAVSKNAELVYRIRAVEVSGASLVISDTSLTYPRTTATSQVRSATSLVVRPTTSFSNESFSIPLARWEQARINRLRAYFTLDGSGDLRIARTYIDVTYVTKPVVTVDAVSPDPYLESTVPVSWSNTLDSDGGQQTRYHIRVFTAAQVADGGFSVSSTKPYVGIDRYSADTDAEVVLPEDSWHVYVRTAQTVNGVSHWSEWDSDAFSVDLAESGVTSVVATPTDASGSISVAVNRDTGTHAWEWVEVQRTIDGGDTWTDVRFATYVDATGDADLFTVVDYEIGNGVDVQYRARATWDDTSGPVVGNWSASSTTVSWSSSDAWVKDPTDPTRNVAVKLREAPSQAWDNRRGVFNVIGRELPVVVADTFGASTSEWVCLVETLADTETLLAVGRSANVLLLHPPATIPDGDRYVSVGRVQRVPVSKRSPLPYQLVSLGGLTETDAPDDPTAGG